MAITSLDFEFHPWIGKAFPMNNCCANHRLQEVTDSELAETEGGKCYEGTLGTWCERPDGLRVLVKSESHFALGFASG